MRLKIWLLIILFSIIMDVMILFNLKFGMLWLLLRIIAYLPISWIGDPFFIYDTEVGAIPTNLGRIAMLMVYSLYYSIFLKIWDIIKKSTR